MFDFPSDSRVRPTGGAPASRSRGYSAFRVRLRWSLLQRFTPGRPKTTRSDRQERPIPGSRSQDSPAAARTQSETPHAGGPATWSSRLPGRWPCGDASGQFRCLGSGPLRSHGASGIRSAPPSGTEATGGAQRSDPGARGGFAVAGSPGMGRYCPGGRSNRVLRNSAVPRRVLAHCAKGAIREWTPAGPARDSMATTGGRGEPKKSPT
jgi:hypothetical protein